MLWLPGLASAHPALAPEHVGVGHRADTLASQSSDALERTLESLELELKHLESIEHRAHRPSMAWKLAALERTRQPSWERVDEDEIPASPVRTESSAQYEARGGLRPVPSPLTVWMFWEQGIDDLEALSDLRTVASDARSDGPDPNTKAAQPGAQGTARRPGTYRYVYKCFTYWQRLNPGHDVRLLDDDSAAALSPAYSALKRRRLPVQLLADVLRLELLSLFGGVWVDTTTCPTKPLDDFLTPLVSANGFFAFRGHYATDEFRRAQQCTGFDQNAEKFDTDFCYHEMNLENW